MDTGPDNIEVIGAKSDTMDRSELSIQLIRSMKEIGSRIDELRIMLGDGPCPGQPERRVKVVERVERLIAMRMKLLYSFMDLNPQLRDRMKTGESCNPFDNMEINFNQLIRHR